MRTAWKVLGLMATVKAASRGPVPLAKRLARKSAHRAVNRWLR